MDIVTKIAPLALALIMLGLGLGLGVNDFKRVLQNPKIFFVGIFSQIVLLPIIAYILILAIDIYRKKNFKLYRSINLLFLALLLQIFLGIITLISGLNIFLASAHQISSVLLIFSAVNLYYCYVK